MISIPHTARLIVVITLTLFSYLSGVVLPFSQSSENMEAGEVLPARSSNDVVAVRVSQVAGEQIQHKKAPPQLPVAKADTKPQEWGVAKQIGEHTWTMTVASDEKVGTAQEILQALNNYRQRHGVGTLAWDTNLGNFAQGRADAFLRNGTTDAHAGFTDFIKNQDGFKKAGFMALGENSSFGYHIEAVHLIEWIYAGDAPHNNNQLSAEWTHVGIGVAGLATDLVFGGRKM